MFAPKSFSICFGHFGPKRLLIADATSSSLAWNVTGSDTKPFILKVKLFRSGTPTTLSDAVTVIALSSLLVADSSTLPEIKNYHLVFCKRPMLFKSYQNRSRWKQTRRFSLSGKIQRNFDCFEHVQSCFSAKLLFYTFLKTALFYFSKNNPKAFALASKKLEDCTISAIGIWCNSTCNLYERAIHLRKLSLKFSKNIELCCIRSIAAALKFHQDTDYHERCQSG